MGGEMVEDESAWTAPEVPDEAVRPGPGEAVEDPHAVRAVVIGLVAALGIGTVDALLLVGLGPWVLSPAGPSSWLLLLVALAVAVVGALAAVVVLARRSPGFRVRHALNAAMIALLLPMGPLLLPAMALPVTLPELDIVRHAPVPDDSLAAAAALARAVLQLTWVPLINGALLVTVVALLTVGLARLLGAPHPKPRPSLRPTWAPVAVFVGAAWLGVVTTAAWATLGHNLSAALGLDLNEAAITKLAHPAVMQLVRAAAALYIGRSVLALARGHRWIRLVATLAIAGTIAVVILPAEFLLSPRPLLNTRPGLFYMLATPIPLLTFLVGIALGARKTFAPPPVPRALTARTLTQAALGYGLAMLVVSTMMLMVGLVLPVIPAIQGEPIPELPGLLLTMWGQAALWSAGSFASVLALIAIPTAIHAGVRRLARRAPRGDAVAATS